MKPRFGPERGYTTPVHGSLRNLFVAVAGFGAAGCTQVHQLGQVEDSADDATSTFSSEESISSSSEDSEDSDDTSGTSSDIGTDSDSETGGPGPIPSACEVVDLGGNEGVIVDIVLMTQWDAGACHELHVKNESPDDVIWTRDLRFGGTLDNFWNAEGEQLNPTDWRFGGQASADNVVVLSGNTVIFGSCMACMPMP